MSTGEQLRCLNAQVGPDYIGLQSRLNPPHKNQNDERRQRTCCSNSLVACWTETKGDRQLSAPFQSTGKTPGVDPVPQIFSSWERERAWVREIFGNEFESDKGDFLGYP